MSGHSKWHKIKHAKAITDKEKGKVFGQLSKEIASAVRQGGPDPTSNTPLRDIIARARKANVPQSNIDRLLSGKDTAKKEEATYEGFGPGGSALLISIATDNPNRTVNEVRSLLKNHGGTLSGPHSVRWKFKEGMTPIYPLTLSQSDQQALTSLTHELTSHPDVTRVITDAVTNS